MSRFNNQWGAFKVIPEPGGGKSMTIPDQSMSIQELLRRFRAGMPLEGQRVPLYEGEDAVSVEVAQMDLIDRENALRAAQEELQATKDRVRRAVEENNVKRIERIIEARNKKLEPKEKPTPPVDPNSSTGA